MAGDNISIAEGIAVNKPGVKTLQVVKALVDEIITVAERSVEEAIVKIMEIEKVVVEGAGAICCGALLQHSHMFKDRKVGIVLTGGNIDSRLLASVIMRGMAREWSSRAFAYYHDGSAWRSGEGHRSCGDGWC